MHPARPSPPCSAGSPESSGPAPGPRRRESERPVPERASRGPAAGPSSPQSASCGRDGAGLPAFWAARPLARQGSQAPLALPYCPRGGDPSGCLEHRLCPQPRAGMGTCLGARPPGRVPAPLGHDVAPSACPRACPEQGHPPFSKSPFCTGRLPKSPTASSQLTASTRPHIQRPRTEGLRAGAPTFESGIEVRPNRGQSW